MKKFENLVVMVVEDEPVQRTCLVAQLTRIGVRHILVAEDGLQASQHLQSRKVDLVFCDIGMPNMDGPQFVLRQLDDMGVTVDHARAYGMPMLAWMSVLGRDMLDSHVRLARMAGFDAVTALSKPLADQAVRAVLESALAGSRPRPLGNCYPLALTSDGLADSLLHAICDAREFDVRYRPLLCLENARMVGAQTVICWPHARFAEMPARLLVGLVERQGLGLVLFYRTFNHLLKVQAQLKTAHHELLLSIDASADTLLAPELVDYLAERMRLYRLRPDHIVVRVCEIGATTDVARLAVCLNRLRIMGFGVCLNDFGSGRANLDLLADMPFNGVCIDGGLVRRLKLYNASAQVIAAIAGLAARLQLQIIASEVDDAAAARALGAMGCQLGQGAIARPLTAAGLLRAASQQQVCCV